MCIAGLMHVTKVHPTRLGGPVPSAQCSVLTAATTLNCPAVCRPILKSSSLFDLFPRVYKTVGKVVCVWGGIYR